MIFELYEKYLSGQQERAEKFNVIAQKKVAAEAELQKLKTEYAVTMTVSVTNGTDVTKALDKLDEQIAKTKREIERAEREYDFYGKIASVPITREDIVAAWNSEFNPQYFEKEINPALEQLEKAKEVYYDAMCNYWGKIKKISDFREEVSRQLGYDYPHFFHIKDLNTKDEYRRYFITEQDMDKAKSGRN
jgi:hypothetical protein